MHFGGQVEKVFEILRTCRFQKISKSTAHKKKRKFWRLAVRAGAGHDLAQEVDAGRVEVEVQEPARLNPRDLHRDVVLPLRQAGLQLLHRLR